MYSPHLQHLLVQDNMQELHRLRRARSMRPITTNERIAARDRKATQLPGYLARAIERFAGQSAREAYAA